MVSVIARASKGQRNLDATGFVKETGTKVAKCVNDQKRTYFVEIKATGETSCHYWAKSKRTGRIVRVECKGHKHTGKCYHVSAVRNADLPSYKVITAQREFEGTVSMNEAIAVMTDYVQEVNAPINQVNSCAYCGHDCRGYACVKCIGF